MNFIKQVVNQVESFNKFKQEDKLWALHLNSKKDNLIDSNL